MDCTMNKKLIKTMKSLKRNILITNNKMKIVLVNLIMEIKMSTKLVKLKMGSKMNIKIKIVNLK